MSNNNVVVRTVFIEHFQHVIQVAQPLCSPTRLPYWCTMGLCCVLRCNNRSDRGPEFRCNLCPNRNGPHNVSFYRIPAIVRDEGKYVLDLTIRRRAGFLASISREDLDMRNLKQYRVCLNHFVSGEPSELTDFTDCDWLPTIRMGHKKTGPPTKAQSERHERAQRRNEEQIVKNTYFKRFQNRFLRKLYTYL